MSKETAPSTYQYPESPASHHGDEADWSYTARAEEVAELRRQLERQRGAAERQTISRDSRIDGGVYEGAYGGEAIVVDSEKYPLINQAVEAVINKVTVGGRVDKGLVLETVYDHVLTNMRYDSAAVEKIFAEDCKGINGQKISLDTYIQDGVGECRHQALYAGAILEKLAERGIVSGKASVERNMIRSGADGKYDGHSWVRYTNSAGTVYIIDVAQQRLASLDSLMQERREGKETWDYGRKEDHDKVRGMVALDATFAAGQVEAASTDLNEPVFIDKLPDWGASVANEQKTHESKLGEREREHVFAPELSYAKDNLRDIATFMAAGTIDGYVLTHELRDVSRRLATVDRELSIAIDDLADEAKTQAAGRHGFSPELITRIRQIASTI